MVDGPLMLTSSQAIITVHDERMLAAEQAPARLRIFSTSCGCATPITCVRAPAGFVSGPSMLKTVRMPISRRDGPTCFIAGWNACANMKPMPVRSIHPATCSGVEVDLRAERLEHVGTAALRRHRAVAVLRDARTGASSNKRRTGADVEGAARVAAGSAGIEHASVDFDAARLLAHDPRHARNLVDRLALHAERGHVRGELRGRGNAGHEFFHAGGRFVLRQVGAIDKSAECVADGERCRGRHTYASSCAPMFPVTSHREEVTKYGFPVGGQDRFGVKLHALDRSVLCRTPMMTPLSLRAVTSSTAGTLSGWIASE